MPFESILLEKTGAVARIILNRRARANAITQGMLTEINQALDTVEADEEVRAVVVSGAGTVFSSGFDLKEQMERRPTGRDTWRQLLRHDFDTVMRFWHCPKPTIAAVRGACVAGACELALACDITIAGEDAFFGEPELKFGAGIVALLLPWIAGPKVAKEIIFTGADRIDVHRARELGIVNRIVKPDEVEQTALDFARHIAVVDPSLMRQTKTAINRSFEIAGMLEALESALAIDLDIEGAGSPDKIRFMEIAREQGLKAAISWRDARFAPAKDN